MSQIADPSLDILRKAMYWEEGRKIVFHSDAYCLGKSLKPLLKSDSASSSMSFALLSTIFDLRLCD
jgi:hypothetical protein